MTNFATRATVPHPGLEPFDDHLFSGNRRPWAFYTYPDQYAQLPATGWNLRRYSSVLPEVLAIAQATHASIPRRETWSRQTRPGGWLTQTEGLWIEARSASARAYPGHALGVDHILRHLAWEGWFSLGNTDRHRDYGYPLSERFEFTTDVHVLRLDVDQPSAWRDRRREDVHREILLARDVAERLGHPFTVFRTGSKGHQVVLRLPAPISRLVASCLLNMFVDLITRHPRQWEAKIDVNNLESITMRLPGGRHAATGRVGFFVDPETARLYPIDRQISLLPSALAPLDTTEEARTTFCDAAREIENACRTADLSGTLGRWQVMPLALLAGVVRQIPQNPLVAAYREALGTLGLIFQGAPLTMAMAAPPTPQEASFDEVSAESVDASSLARGVISPATLERSRQILQTGFRPGESYSYYRADGRNAIRHAIIVHGREAGRDFLIRQARATPASGDDAHTARVALIDWLMERHHFYVPVEAGHMAIDGEVAPSDSAIAARVVALVQERRSAAKRRRLRPRVAITVQHVLELILTALRHGGADETGAARISFRTFAHEIQRRWPDDSVSYNNVEDALAHIVAGGDAFVDALERLDGPVVPQLAAARYCLGDDLLALISLSDTLIREGEESD